MSENAPTSYGAHLKRLTSVFESGKSMTDILNSFRCISESYNNIIVKENHYSSNNFNECTEKEKEYFINDQLSLINCLVINSIYEKVGFSWTWDKIFNLLIDPEYAGVEKTKRKVVYPTSQNNRPIGDIAYQMWNGLQIIDLDIKNEQLANKLKIVLFKELNKFHWFLGVTKSASGKGLHVWTKITPISIKPDQRKIEFLCNFRHKYSYIYIILLNYATNNVYTKTDIISFMDMAMAKPQQGIFISSDKDALMNTNFQDLRLDVNFEIAFDNGISSVNWLSHQDLKDIFSKLEWFNNENFDDSSNVDISAISNIDERDMSKATGRKHYKHNQRWQLANTLTSLYGADKAYEIMCQICSQTSQRELKGDVKTAQIHNKPISVWAVKELNKYHGFKINVKVENEQFQETINKIIDEVNKDNKIDYVTELTAKDRKETLYIKHDQYLGDIKDEIISKLKKITLLEAGAGYGKTEMIKALQDKTLLILPFTSTIKAKVEADKKTEDWLYYYGSKTPNLQDIMGDKSLSMTIDKFSRLNLFELNAANFKYIVIDESHLLFTSSFREVMSPAIQRLANCNAKVIMMTGTPTGEKLFFPNIQHIKVEKEDLRDKKFQIFFCPTKTEQIVDMCNAMAEDIMAGRKILFPTNKGNLFFEQIIGLVERIIQQKTHNQWDRKLNYFYYKKSNTGEQSMDDINIGKSIGKNDIIFCTSFLSVGVDICDRFEFRVYFNELWIAQDIEQFANRIRNNDLYIKIYLPKRDSNGYPYNYDITRALDLGFDKTDLITVRDFIRTCNDLLDRNNEEYKYNPLVQGIISAHKFLKYDENDCKYYIDETAYKLQIFEDRYMEYGKQLQILIKGMSNFGYVIESHDSNQYIIDDKKDQLEQYFKEIRHIHIDKFTKDTSTFLDHLTEDNIELYKELTKGNYEIFRSDKYENLRGDNNLYVESIEVLEKNVPLVLRLYKYYNCDTIKEIYDYCLETKTQKYNFSAIQRICNFTSLEEQRKKKKIDFPVLRFMQDTKKWVEEEPKRPVDDVKKYIDIYTCKYANTVKDVVLSDVQYLETIKKYITSLFDTIVIRGKSKNFVYNLQMFELLWDKKNDLDLTNIYGDANTAQFFAQEFFNIKDENDFEEDEAPDFVLTPKKTAEDIESEIPNIVHSDFNYFKYSEMDGSNNRFMRKQKNTDKTNNGFNTPSEEVKKEVEKEINLFSDNTEELPF
jgi:hypothetical protein